MYIKAGLLFIVLLMALEPKLGLSEPDIDAEYRSAYFGCYEGNKFCGILCGWKRILLKSAKEDSDSMTVKYCIDKCREYTYAGVVYRDECFCGNKIKTGFLDKPEYHCHMPCKGDSNVICGVPKTRGTTSSTLWSSISTATIANRLIQSTSNTLPSSQETRPKIIKSTEPTKIQVGLHLYRSETAPSNATGTLAPSNTTVTIIHHATEMYNNSRDDAKHKNVDRDQPSSSQNAATTMIALFSVIGFLVLLILVSGTINAVLFRSIYSSRRNTATPCSTKEHEHSSVVTANQAYNADMVNHRTRATDYEMLGENSLNDHIYERPEPEQSENTKVVYHT